MYWKRLVGCLEYLHQPIIGISMEYSTEYDKQFIKAINQFWSKEISLCTSGDQNAIRDIHKDVQILYDIQQAIERGEAALAKKMVHKIENRLKKVIPPKIQKFNIKSI